VCAVFDSMVLGTTFVRRSLLSVTDNLAAPRDLRNATTLGSDGQIHTTDNNINHHNNNNTNNNNSFVERHSAVASEVLAEQVS